jgi:antitoxin CptB
VIVHQADPKKRARLRWRARRGLLENDLLITRFLDNHETTMTDDDVDAFSRLMDLGDNELLNLLLSKSEPTDELDAPEVHALLCRMREA